MAEDKNKYILSIQGMSKSFGRNKVLSTSDRSAVPADYNAPEIGKGA